MDVQAGRTGPGPGNGGQRVTMSDLARRLGISKAAVSYALNGQPGVAAETRDRVTRLAAELGWHPSSSARALSANQTGVVGLVLSRPAELLTVETFFMRFLAGLERVLSERGSSLLLRVVGDRPEEELRTYERWWGERRIDGVILLDERYHDSRIAAVERIGVPAVLCGGPIKGTSIPCLWTDQAADSRSAVMHLAELGHRHIAHISGPLEFAHERGRRRGVRRAATALGLEVTTVTSSYMGPQAGEITGELLDSPQPPTAIIYGSDVMALGGLAAASQRRVRIPRDLSVISWDDTNLTTVVHPPLTALERDTPGFGALAATVLLDHIHVGRDGLIQVPPSTLRARESTGPAPATA
jgi:DNA-binding LacI/PurR family transcriptional regulator